MYLTYSNTRKLFTNKFSCENSYFLKIMTENYEKYPPRAQTLDIFIQTKSLVSAVYRVIFLKNYTKKYRTR